jgi:serine protease AprX
MSDSSDVLITGELIRLERLACKEIVLIKKLLTMVVFCCAGVNLLCGASAKMAQDLKAARTGSIRVIVQFSAPAVPANPTLLGAVGTTVSGATALVGQIVGLGGVVNQLMESVNMLVCTLPVSAVETLSNNANVVYMTPDRALAARLDYTAAAVNAGAAWKSNLTGQGIGVAIIDSGIDVTSVGLLPRVVYSQDFTGGDGSDGYGHGTHVAGIVGSDGLGSACAACTRTFIGMAPSSSLINLRVLDASGQGSDSALIMAIDKAISLRKIFNIRVMNLSLGRPVYESYKLDPVCQAVEAAWKAGIVVVAAAGNDGRDNSFGNDGYATIEAPGNDPYVITVGAMKAMGTYDRSDDLIASYSSKGPTMVDHIVKPDLVAPGNHVVSLLSPNSTLAEEPADLVPLSYYETTTSNAASKTFMMLNGTSMATPVVSGAAADILQQHPDLTPDQVKARLMKTAYKTFPETSTAVDPVTGQVFVSQYDIMTVGAGYLDIAAALKNHDLAAGTAMSPAAVYDASSGSVYLTFDPSSIWGSTNAYGGGTIGTNSSVWGTSAVWGTSVVDADKSVWGTSAVWGTSSESAFKAVWGTSSVWGTSTLAGAKAVWGTDSSTSDSDKDFQAVPR